ncbi:MAG: MBL fold metallo-hydrolase [Candidatus Methanofastidiosa archaeon]|nr:MBL fold metallo-hydrolase [Candidatus Methanofastidiosa archaeon]
MLSHKSLDDIDICTCARPLAGKILLASKVYRVGTAMIDGGIYVGDGLRRIMDGVGSVLVTHPHPDHAGYCRPVQEWNGAAVYAHQGALGYLSCPVPPPLLSRRVAGVPRPCLPSTCPETVDAGVVVLRALDTPGHVPPHLSFIDEDNSRGFTGDLVLHGSSPWAGPEVHMADAVDSLERLASLGLSRLYPGHGRPFDNPGKDLEEKMAHMRDLGASVRALHERGLSERDIQVRLLGHEGPVFYGSQGFFSKRNLIRGYLRCIGSW